MVAYIAFGVSYLMRPNFTADATFFLAMITILLDGIPPHKITLVSGLSNFTRITGGGFAASIVTTLWDRCEALHQSRMADQTTIFTPGLSKVLVGLHSAGFPDLEAKAAVTRTMTSQAYLLAANDIFWASGWICILLIGMVWLCKRAGSGGGAPVAAD